jgi:signal transduction histidine kinase
MDRAQAVQTVFALCLNAAEAMPEGGEVTVTTEPAALAHPRSAVPSTPLGRSYLRCRIRDAGPGLSQDTQAKVFSPLFTTKPAGRGTGLGLAMARAAVEANEGWLELAANEGGGTTITIHLPLACSGLEP